MSTSFNIDIHCHPSTKPYMSGITKKINPFKSFDHKIESTIMKIIKGLLESSSEVKFASQSNFDHLFEGGHRVVIASITPMERAFLVANLGRKSKLTNAFIYNNKTLLEDTIKPKLINSLMGFSIANIEFVRDADKLQDYFFEGLQPEYDYLKSFNGQQSPGHDYSIKLVKNFSEIKEGMASGEKAIYVLLSIEGAHSFKPAPHIIDIKAGQNKQHTPAELNDMMGSAQIQNNVRRMKTEWEFVPLYVTMMHHFWNEMGGHARSLNKLVGDMLNQQEGINQPLSEKGKMVIRDLLSTKFDRRNGDQIETVTMPRVLIDIKHMSIASRKEYYQMLETEFAGQNIPIICSHTGIAGRIDSLDELLQLNDKDEEEITTNYFHMAQINLCGEDIRTIAKSKGLIGIQLDEKRIAGAGFVKSKLRGSLTLNEQMHECSKLVMANVFMAVNAIKTLEAWNLFCIGSDYDGLINHLDPFPTTRQISILRDEVTFFLNNLVEVKDEAFDFTMTTDEMKTLMMGLTGEQIAQKIFSDNAMKFLSVNFRR